jgi:hypothetical protein
LIDEDDDCKEEDEDDYGAGLEGGFESINGLHALKYRQAMKTKEKDNSTDALFEEHKRTVKHQ